MRPRDSAPDALVVFSIRREDVRCAKCGDDSTRWYRLIPNESGTQDAWCLQCSGLDDLVLLPTGNPALTRRTRARSTRSAALVEWAPARKRYERVGWLVEEAAIVETAAELAREGRDPRIVRIGEEWMFRRR